MPKLRWLPSAQADLVTILEYVTRASGSLAAGQQFVSELRGRCKKLASLPGKLGRPRPELREDVRSVVHKSYVIFFRYHNASLEVVNIIEGHRDIEMFYLDSRPASRQDE